MQVPVSTRIAGAGAAGFAGNVLIGGVIGMGVDAATGSTLEHYPNPVLASLVPHRKATASSGRHRPAARRTLVTRPKADEATPQS